MLTACYYYESDIAIPQGIMTMGSLAYSPAESLGSIGGMSMT
jgi:hypothetical protein